MSASALALATVGGIGKDGRSPCWDASLMSEKAYRTSWHRKLEVCVRLTDMKSHGPFHGDVISAYVPV